MVLDDLMNMFDDSDASTFDVNASPFFCVRKQPEHARNVCADFEKNHGLSSSSFEKMYQAGTIPKDLSAEDAFYWMHQVRILARLTEPAGFTPDIAEAWKEKIPGLLETEETEEWFDQKGGNASLYCCKSALAALRYSGLHKTS